MRWPSSGIFGATPAEVTSEQRRYAKVINFGLIYGMSAFGLARQLGLERSAAAQYMERYFARYPGVDAYMADQRSAGLVIIQDGKVRFEKYGLGFDAKGRWTSFSVAKSFTSTLVGAAIKDGKIDAFFWVGGLPTAAVTDQKRTTFHASRMSARVNSTRGTGASAQTRTVPRNLRPQPIAVRLDDKPREVSRQHRRPLQFLPLVERLPRSLQYLPRPHETLTVPHIKSCPHDRIALRKLCMKALVPEFLQLHARFNTNGGMDFGYG